MKILFNFLLLIFVIIILSPSFSVSQDLIFATDDTPGTPYIMGSGNDFIWDKPGIEIEIYQLVAQKLGLKIKFERLPWKRCLYNLKVGQVDGIFPASFKAERIKLGVYPMKNGHIDPSRKTRENSYYLYKKRDSLIEWNGGEFVNINSMRRKEIGAPLGWAIVSILKNQGIEVVEKPNPIDLFDMLIGGGLAGVACLETVADSYTIVHADKYKDIIKTSIPLLEKPYYLMLSHQFSAKNPIIAEKIWDTIAEIKNSEKFKMIAAKYY